MSLLTCASGNSVYRGYDYYNIGRVIFYEDIGEGQFKGVVAGSTDGPYEVFIDVHHPRKSHCNCPHANGKRIICKHQIALFLKAFPDEAQKYKAELEEYYEYEEWAIDEFLDKCTKTELENIIWQILSDGPEWQYESFVRY